MGSRSRMAVEAFEAFVTEVNTLNNLLRKRAARLLRNDSLAPAELRVLQILRNDGARTVPEIGRLRLTSRQNIQITVNRLKKSGMVEFAPNPSHKRSGLVRLTAQGQEVLEHAQEKGTLSGREIGTDISEDEISRAMEFLRKVRKALAPEARVRKQRGGKPGNVSPQPASPGGTTANETGEPPTAPCVRGAFGESALPGVQASSNSPEPAAGEQDELPVNLL